MPQQESTGQASEDSVKAFMELDDAGQTKALSKMSPEAKNWLLLGVRGLKSAQPQQMPQQDDKGWMSGAINRVLDTAKGFRKMVAPTEEEEVEQLRTHTPGGIISGVKETYKEGGRQAKQQFESGEYARSAVTAGAMLNPFATGSVTDMNRMIDQGRYREAIGAGVVDALMLWAGSRTGKAPTTVQRISKLTSALGETGETVKNLERVLPEIDKTAKQVGKPATIGEFAGNVRTSLNRLEAEFKGPFDPIKHNRAYTPAIKNHIDRILRENPNLMKTPEGRAEVAALRSIQRQYDKPWTLEDMNLERSRLRKQMRSLYDAKPTDAAAKMKLDAELRAKKVVADSFSETVNDHLAHVTGKPREYFDILRQKQESLLDLNDHLDTEVEKLRDRQAARAGRTVGERLRPHAYVSGAGPRVHIPFGEAVPAEGASDVASRKVRQGFGPTPKARAARAAILALPVSHLATAGDEAKRARMTPPPSPEE